MVLSLFHFLVLIFSIIIHEVSHGAMAKELGDDTAEKMGRLTLNPLAHLDFFGSVFLPLFLFISTSGQFVFGWAKPVPYNPFKLKNPRRDSALLAFSGPLANLGLALIFGILIRLKIFPLAVLPYFLTIVSTNLVLAIFNLTPIPPLDGSKILFYLFPSPKLEIFMLQYGFFLLIFFLFFGWGLIAPLINFLFHLMTGV